MTVGLGIIYLITYLFLKQVITDFTEQMSLSFFLSGVQKGSKDFFLLIF